jgi:aspartyl-tRNA(Asn)/glutamyl-tRNA(Gln) amidotransferase subunit B
MSELQPTIGLEIHAELKTQTKMFCNSKNDPDEKRPNVNICPICMAHPGTLPVINKKAVEHVLRVGLAVGGTLADFTEFDRKNYFYPDIPKGYQISQYKFPLVSGGRLKDVELTRIHLEEDTARSQHDDKTGESLVDFNRAGVPLMELVTEPVITSAKQAGDFARELQLLLRYLGVAEANMEKGELRVEANISWSMGTKVEVKNLNSFRSVERAIEYELARQKELIESGGKVEQETRGWDDVKGITFSQRKKESSHDYRYFPDPDLPKLWISQIPEFQNLATTIPELPWQKRARYAGLGFLQEQDVEQLVGDFELAKFFDDAAKELKTPELIKIAANLILNVIAGQRKKDPIWTLPELMHFAEVVRRYQSGAIASTQCISSGRVQIGSFFL